MKPMTEYLVIWLDPKHGWEIRSFFELGNARAMFNAQKAAQPQTGISQLRLAEVKQ